MSVVRMDERPRASVTPAEPRLLGDIASEILAELRRKMDAEAQRAKK